MKAIIFDCDGTLVDSEMLHYTAWIHALKRYNCTLDVEEYAAYVGIPIDKACLFLAQKIGINCADELKKDKHAFFSSKIHEGVAPIEGTLTFLHKLVKEQSRLQYKLAIASGASSEEIILYLRHLEIEHVFDVIVSGKDDLQDYNDSEGINKPKPYIYIETAKRLGLNPIECIAIEDSHPGVMASHNAGCITVAIPTPFSIYHDFSKSDLLIPSLHNYTVDQFLNELSSKMCTKS